MMERITPTNYSVSIVLQGLLVLILLQFGVAVAGGQELSPSANNNFRTQSEALKAEKEARTPVQKKVNSAIIRHLHTKVLRDRPETLPKLESGVVLTNKNEVLTDIKANVNDSVLAIITNNGGTIINKFPQYKSIRALIPITAIETIAAHPDIQFIDLAAEYTTN